MGRWNRVRYNRGICWCKEIVEMEKDTCELWKSLTIRLMYFACQAAVFVIPILWLIYLALLSEREAILL